MDQTQYVWSQPRKIKLKRGRGPASATPRDDIQVQPYENKVWLGSVFVADSAGVMNHMKNKLIQWERVERYRENWNIESTGLYDTPDRGDKKAWFNRMLLKYADKRLSGELKNAEEGSTLQRVRTVKQALKPDTEASISSNIKLKFKARVIQMRGIMNVVNPWVESETIVTASGDISSRLSKDFKSLGVSTDLNYQVNEGAWSASVSKPLTQSIRATITSHQASNNIVRFSYYKPF